MKNVKKILIALLAMLLCAATLTSCLGSGTAVGGFGALNKSDGSENIRPNTNANMGDLKIVEKSGSGYFSDYQIVYQESGGNEANKALAYEIRTAIKQLTGVTLPIRNDLIWEDEPDTLPKDKEILVGYTNREDSGLYVIPESLEEYGYGYCSFVSGQRLVIMTGSRTGGYFALRDLVYNFCGQDLNSEELDMEASNLSFVPAKNDWVIAMNPDDGDDSAEGTVFDLASEHFPFLGVSVNKFTIVSDGSYLLKRMTNIVRTSLQEATGLKPATATKEVLGATSVIRLQLIDKEEADTGDNEWIEPGKWTIEFVGPDADSDAAKGFTIKASSYYGFIDAANWFKTSLTKYGFYSLGKTDIMNGNGDYIESITAKYEGTRYCYDKQGDTRVMFANVLFNSSAGGENPGDYVYSVPVAERDQIQALMFAEYMPDVLGCQEFNYTRRGNTEAAALAGRGGLAAELTKLGYIEAVDPVVRNAYQTNEIIPGTDASLTVPGAEPGTPLMGYGTNGAHNVNGIYTFYNNAPLFYNSKTTKLLEAEYYWYKNQWDKGMLKDENGETIVHPNSNGDAGSKAATWGVFESLESGQKYIVISTHMCTRSDYVRELQGIEIVALIKDLVARYDCPVFFGGDMNGNRNGSNYNVFVAEDTWESKYRTDADGNPLQIEGGGYTSLQDNPITKIYSSNLISSHGYPDYDSESRLMTPGRNDITKVTFVDPENPSKSSIDQIFVTNLGDDIILNVYGTVVDDCSLSSSDHLPLYVDFHISGETHEGAEWGPNVNS